MVVKNTQQQRGVFGPGGADGRYEWETPGEFFAVLDEEFGFTLDVAATRQNAKCKRFFSPRDDGLNKRWAPEVCWMNPPYGRAIVDWMRKAWLESKRGATVVCLVPARTETGWWHDYAMRGEIRFIRGRLRFSGMPHNAPFPCAVVIFRSGSRGRLGSSMVALNGS